MFRATMYAEDGSGTMRRDFQRFDAAVGWAELKTRKTQMRTIVEAGEVIDEEFVPFSDGVIVDVWPQTMADAA